MNAKKLINDLLKSDLTQMQIAAALGCSQAYISDLSKGKRGTRISFEVGTRLEKFHFETLGAKHGKAN